MPPDQRGSSTRQQRTPTTPEPSAFHAALRQPREITQAWLNSIESELQNLIEINHTFQIEDPRHNEQVIPTKLVLKAKSLADGSLDKLKQKDNEWQDTWSACVSMRTVKMFLALACLFLQEKSETRRLCRSLPASQT